MCYRGRKKNEKVLTIAGSDRGAVMAATSGAELTDENALDRGKGSGPMDHGSAIKCGFFM